jgi:hypothetical protein
MGTNDQSPDWGKFIPAEDSGQPSLLARQGEAAGDGSTAYFVWEPPEDLKGLLPEDFKLPFRVHIGQDGLRRVSPVGTFESHIAGAWLGGFAVLCRSMNLNPEQRQSYRVMWFLYQRVRRMKEHQRRAFRSRRDLLVSESGRLSPEDISVIPIFVKKQDKQGKWNDVRLKLDELLARGHEAAVQVGISNPRRDQEILHGLASFAEDEPLSIPDDEVQLLIRKSLFDFDSSEPAIKSETMEIVYQRFVDAFMGHLGDERVQFNAWFSDRNNSVLKQIAKLRLAPGGRLELADVRAAMLQLGWDAYQHVADCLSALMQAVAKSIPEPLTRSRSLLKRTFDSPITETCRYSCSGSGSGSSRGSSWISASTPATADRWRSCIDCSSTTRRWWVNVGRPTSNESVREVPANRASSASRTATPALRRIRICSPRSRNTSWPRRAKVVIVPSPSGSRS